MRTAIDLAAPALSTTGTGRRSFSLRCLRAAFLLPVLAALGAAGCIGDPKLANPAVIGPHGQPAVPIPGGLGYGEARLEPAVEAKPAAGKIARSGSQTGRALKKGQPACIVVYLLDPDGKTPLGALPEKLVAEVGLPGTLSNHYLRPFELRSAPRSEDPESSARFASQPFPLPDERISGRVKLAVQGQDLSFPLVITSLR